MTMLRRSLTLFVAALLIMNGAAFAQDVQVSVTDASGQAAVMTVFTAEGVPSWWAQLPEDSALDGLDVQVSDDTQISWSLSGDEQVSAPDAGSNPAGAGYIIVNGLDGEGNPAGAFRVYVSREAYAPVVKQDPRTYKAVGRWCKVSGNSALYSAAGSDGIKVGVLNAETTLWALYSCRVQGKDYTAVLIAGETCFVRSDRVQVMNVRSNLTYDTALLTEKRNSENVFFAKAAYNSNLRSTLGGSNDAVIATAPVGTLLLVMTQVTFDQKSYDLVFWLDKGTIGFAHDSQLVKLQEAETALLLAGSSGPETETDLLKGHAAVTKNAELRAFPSADAQVSAELAAGDTVTVYTAVETPDGLFALVSAGEQMGYVLCDALQNDPEAVPSEQAAVFKAKMTDALYGDTVAVTVREAVIYAQPAFSAALVARVGQNTHFVSTQSKDGWLKVSADGLEGWLPSAFAQALRLGVH